MKRQLVLGIIAFVYGNVTVGYSQLNSYFLQGKQPLFKEGQFRSFL